MEIYLLYLFQWKELQSFFHLLVEQANPEEGELFNPQEMEFWGIWDSSHFCTSITPRCLVVFYSPAHLQTHARDSTCVFRTSLSSLAACPQHLLNYTVTGLWVNGSCSVLLIPRVKVRHWLHHLVVGATSLELGPRGKGLASSLFFSWYKTEFLDRWFIHTWPLLE